MNDKNELQVADIIGDEYVNKVRTYASLGYTPNRICRLLSLSKKEGLQLVLRMSIAGDAYHDAFVNGQMIGEYNIDVEIAKKAEVGDLDAIELLEERKNKKVELDTRKELFGV